MQQDGSLVLLKREQTILRLGRRHYCLVKYKQCWLGGGNSNIFYFHPYLGKRWTQFDFCWHIFLSMGGRFNHQPVGFTKKQPPQIVAVVASRPTESANDKPSVAVFGWLSRTANASDLVRGGSPFFHWNSYPKICKIRGLDHRKWHKHTEQTKNLHIQKDTWQTKTTTKPWNLQWNLKCKAI